MPKSSKIAITNRQLDFLSKWHLWMLQARELARHIPTVAILGSANSEGYHQRTTGINPPNYHDRGAGYGITRDLRKRTGKSPSSAGPITTGALPADAFR